MRSHFSLVANKGRGSVNRSPQGAIRGGFAVSPQNSGRLARCACLSGALARARRERRASSMSAAWDSSPALSPVPWGERSREAFNCVPGDQQSAPLVNSFGARDGAKPVDHRGDGSRGATNGCPPSRVESWSREVASIGVVAGAGGPVDHWGYFERGGRNDGAAASSSGSRPSGTRSQTSVGRSDPKRLASKTCWRRMTRSHWNAS